VGVNNSSVSFCFSNATVSGYNNIAGLAGRNNSVIEQCYASGSIQGAERVAGVVGENNGLLTYCYSTAEISGNTYVGGLVGLNCQHYEDPNKIGVISNCYWDTQASSRDNMCGAQWAPATGADNSYGKTTAQMKTKSIFINTGWDFVRETANGMEDIWRLCEDLVSYPRLVWEFPLGDIICPDGIDFFDYSFFAGHWAEDNCDASCDCDGTDLDLLGTVNINDLRIFVDNWLKYPPPLQASNPNPADGSFSVNRTADLSWTAGLYATSHDLYFGTSNPPPFISVHTTTTFDPGEMAYGTTYYWRIDEVNSSGITTGKVWNFTTLISPPPPPPF
jgi:hypothetical protein